MEEDSLDVNGPLDEALKFATYEDYLDSQISATDLYYLEDEELARQLVELGYRGSGETLKRVGRCAVLVLLILTFDLDTCLAGGV